MALQVHVSTNQLINTARVLSDPTQQHLLQALAPLHIHQQQQQQQQQQAHSTAHDNGQPQLQQQQHTTGPGPSNGPAEESADVTPTAGALPQIEHHQQQQQQLQQQQQQQQDHQQWRHLPPSGCIVVGDDYYAAKEQLFVTEQVVLRIMRFQLEVEQPHKYLFNFCRLLDVQQQLAAAAAAVLNDAIAYTALVCRTRAAVLAAAALQSVLQTDLFQGICLISTDAHTMGTLGVDRGGLGGRGPGSGRRSDLGTVQYQRSSSSSHRRDSHEDRRDSRSHDVRQSFGSGSSVAQQCCASGEWVTLIGLEQGDVSAALQELQKLFERLIVL
jgi:hypothetical protein